MNFTLETKNEIISKKMNNNELKAFANGVIFSNLKNKNEIVKIKFLNQFIFDKFIEILNTIKYEYRLENKSILIKYNHNQKISAKSAINYLAGIFVSSGSISNLTSSSYHLQMSFKNKECCDEILEFSKKHINFFQTKNKNYYILYLKKNELISDFLNIIGAQKSYFDFIESVIERDFKNQITRIFNLDVHNQKKLVTSNQTFLDNLEYIYSQNLEHLFSKEQLIFYEFKKQNQFLPLSQLSEELEKEKNIKKTKGGLNHWLIKLKKICDENKDS